MFLWLKTLYRKRAVTWPFIFYTIIWTLSIISNLIFIKIIFFTHYQDINITALYFLQFFKHIYLQQVITSVIMQNDNKTDIQSVTSYKMLIY